MYKYVLIGYTINVGEFTPDDQPEKKIPYSNREIWFITNCGENTYNKGFKPFKEKFKLSELAKILNVQPNDSLVNDALNALVNKAVNVQLAPVGDSFKVVYFELAK